MAQTFNGDSKYNFKSAKQIQLFLLSAVLRKSKSLQIHSQEVEHKT